MNPFMVRMIRCEVHDVCVDVLLWSEATATMCHNTCQCTMDATRTQHGEQTKTSKHAVNCMKLHFTSPLVAKYCFIFALPSHRTRVTQLRPRWKWFEERRRRAETFLKYFTNEIIHKSARVERVERDVRVVPLNANILLPHFLLFRFFEILCQRSVSLFCFSFLFLFPMPYPYRDCSEKHTHTLLPLIRYYSQVRMLWNWARNSWARAGLFSLLASLFSIRFSSRWNTFKERRKNEKLSINCVSQTILSHLWVSFNGKKINNRCLHSIHSIHCIDVDDCLLDGSSCSVRFIPINSKWK